MGAIEIDIVLIGVFRVSNHACSRPHKKPNEIGNKVFVTYPVCLGEARHGDPRLNILSHAFGFFQER